MADNEKDNNSNNFQTDNTPDSDKSVNNSISDEPLMQGADSKATKKQKKEKTILREVLSWVYTIAGAVVLAFVITTFIIVNAVVPTESMEDTIKAGDRLIALRLSYLFSDPERYDIVVFKYPDNEDILYIKRIIGLPGEKIKITPDENGMTKVYVNDSEVPLYDGFIREPMELKGNTEDRNIYTAGKTIEYTVPDGCYFMLGDNRNNSKDSRFWENKFVEKDKILGKALFKYYPSIEWIDNSYNPEDNK